MTPERFEALLSGCLPTPDDFVGFLSVLEKLPTELLWKLSQESESLHWMLRTPLLTTLQEKVSRRNIDDALDAIVTRLASKP